MKKKKPKPLVYEQPKREQLSQEEIIKRMQELPLRKEKILAAIRKVKS